MSHLHRLEQLFEKFGYTDKEETKTKDAIEKQIPRYLRKKFPDSNIYKVHNDWRRLQRNKIDEVNKCKNRDERSITDFDGLYIVSNDDAYEIGVELVYNDAKRNNTLPKTYFLVVVEAKHGLTTTKVNKKIEQIKEFQNYIKESLNFLEDIYTKEYKDKVYVFQLQHFIDGPIYLIFASPHMDEDCIQYIKNASGEHNISLAYMVPTGNRYSISFADEGFVQYSNVNTNTLSIGRNTIKGGKN